MLAKKLTMRKRHGGRAALTTSKSLFKAFFFSFLFLTVSVAWAQPNLTCDGNVQTVGFTGTYQDFIVPDDPSVGQIEITLKGGDGGFARLGSLCKSDGGEGAKVFLIIELGEGAGKVPYGSTLRFVVARAGEKGTGEATLGTGFTYGGGGGGTGFLFKAPGEDNWQILAVAGGGGGAYQGAIVGICVDNEDGQGGRATQEGGSGNGDIEPGQGGSSGSGGQAGGINGLEISGGGGGQWHAGSGVTCTDITQFFEVAEGQAGYPEGGAGGGSEGCFSFTFRDGGYGYGGGGAGVGAGGGGGGFSGGGGGGTTGRGGGGGSYANLNYTQNPQIMEGGLTGITEDGYALYKCVLKQQPPVAQCNPDSMTVVALNDLGTASITPADVDNGSFDPDGGQLSYSINPAVFDCSQVGYHIVTLTIKDQNAMTASCDAVVKVEDQTAPTLECPESIVREADVQSCSAVVTFFESITAKDNCTFALSATAPDTMLYPVGNTEVTVTATDESGNSTSCTFAVTVKDQAPPAIVCPESKSVSCGESSAPDALGTAVAEDLCGAASVDFADTAMGADCGDDQAILRTWTATDLSGNQATCTQQISIIPDTEAPVVTCAPNVAVNCGEDIPDSAMATATDNCDAAPELTFTDTMLDGDCNWSCRISRVWTAKDACNNTGTCTQIIEKSALGLIQGALDMDVDGDGISDPILLGRAGRTSLILENGAAECLVQWLPHTNGAPSGLPRGQVNLDGTNCQPAGYPFDGDGHLTNPFLGEAITLAIYIRLNPDFGNTPILSTGCTFHPVIFQGLPPNPTVNDLMAQVNLILSNSFTPFYTQFGDALACINDLYTLCGDQPTDMRPQTVNLHPATVAPSVSEALKVFPNPTTGSLFVAAPQAVNKAEIIVRTLDGRVVLRRAAQQVAKGELISLDLSGVSAGIYFLEFNGESGRVVQKVVVE